MHIFNSVLGLLPEKVLVCVSLHPTSGSKLQTPILLEILALYFPNTSITSCARDASVHVQKKNFELKIDHQVPDLCTDYV
jgi:hypothetical protein